MKQEKEKKSSKVINDRVSKIENRFDKLTKDMKQFEETIVSAISRIKTDPVIVEKTVQDIPGTADLSKVKEPIVSPQTTAENKNEGGGKSEKMPIPPGWRKLVDEILGMDFGIDVVYPQSGSGFLFKIIVPEEKSNMSKDYREFYKVDVRTKAVSYNEGSDGIKRFCESVQTNLKRNQTN